MGGCASISSRSTSNGEEKSPSCLWIDMFRRKRRRMFSDHVTSVQNLSSIPNRRITNGRSSTSCIFTQQGRKGINQDAMIVWEDFMAEDVTFCGVFDGHGPHGHLVARKVRDMLPLKLASFVNSSGSKMSVNCCNGNVESDVVKETDEQEVESVYREAFLKAYKAMDKELKSHPSLDCFCSGSTGVTVIKQGQNLFIGNIGDSRAIMGSKDSNDQMVATQLTVDLKPDLPREAERIKRCKGRVFALQDEPEVQRVWLPFDDAPGLAMARAFGDFCLKEYGVISVPDFSRMTLSDRDKFVVLASDGVWDVLSNEDVVAIISSSPTRSSAARLIVEASAREWRVKYPTSKADDCAIVCLFLDEKMDSESDPEAQGFASETLESVHVAEAEHPEPCLRRNFTVRSSEENEGCIAVEAGGGGEQNWSGLEGVTRVNSLVQLPRFSQEKKRP